MITSSGMKSVGREFRDFPLINGPHAFADIFFSQFILYALITREFGLEELAFFSTMVILLLGSMKAIGGAVGQLYYKEASERLAQNGDVSYALWCCFLDLNYLGGTSAVILRNPESMPR
jgi:hypothetical protein